MADWKSRATPVNSGGGSWRDKYVAPQAPAEQPNQPAVEHTAGEKAQTGLESFADTATLGYLPHLQAGVGAAMGLGDYVKLRDENIARQKQQEQEMPGASVAGKVAGFGANLLVPGKLPAMVAQAALANPGDTEGQLSGPQLDKRVENAGMAALLGKGGELLGKGLVKGGDYLAQKAANIRKTAPGLGEELIKSGVVGTKGMMKGRLASQMPGAVEDLEGAVSGIEGPISGASIAEKLQNAADRYKIGDTVPSGAQGIYSKFQGAIDDLKKIGQGESLAIDPKDLQKWKQIHGDLAHLASGAPGASDAALVSKVAGGEARDLLSQAAKQPSGANPYEAANKKLSAFLKAKSGLEKGPSLTDVAELAALTGIGYGFGGGEGALKGALLKTPLAKSAGGAGLYGLGKGLELTAPQAARAYSLFGTEKK